MSMTTKSNSTINMAPSPPRAIAIAATNGEPIRDRGGSRTCIAAQAEAEAKVTQVEHERCGTTTRADVE